MREAIPEARLLTEQIRQIVRARGGNKVTVDADQMIALLAIVDRLEASLAEVRQLNAALTKKLEVAANEGWAKGMLEAEKIARYSPARQPGGWPLRPPTQREIADEIRAKV